jgi:flagellar assembly protein FliH
VTSLIRSARLAAEAKTVPVPQPLREVHNVALAGRVYPHAGEPLAESPAPLQSVPAVTPVLTYEEYKQRFAGELTELRQRALDDARAQGLQQGRAAAEAQARQLLKTWHDLIESVQRSRQQHIEAIGDDAIEIVFAAVARVLGDAFASRAAAVAAVQEAIRSCRDKRCLTVRVAPADLAVIESQRQTLNEGIGANDVTVVADEQVGLGGCLLESPSGDLDARLETQLQRLRETLVRARESWDQAPEPSHG